MDNVTAVLLCGGKGERLKPFTDTLPKPLVPLNGRPILHHLLQYLARSGVARFAVCTGHMAGAIERYLAEHADPAWKVACVNSGDASMTDRILDARPHIAEQALICYGDTLANVDLAALRAGHREHGALATVTVHPLRSPFGVVHFDDDDRVASFAEKPVLPYWMNIGFILCEREAFRFLKPKSDMIAFLSGLAAAGALYVHKHSGKHLTVNDEKDRTAAETEIATFSTVLGVHRS
jgi:glucose-1-phosphate cytidylyltransferase